MLNIKRDVTDLTYFDDIDIIIKNHSAFTHPLFAYIYERAQKGFTSRQFEIYRCNYFHRTFNTIPSVARLVEAAARNMDIETLSTAGKNLYEETGSGDPSKVHSYLLQASHNQHAASVFELEYLSLVDTANSALLIPEALMFEKSISKLYSSKLYSIVLGTAYAHEMTANAMLIAFYECFFASYREHYSTAGFYQLVEYFLTHISGIEDEHASDCKAAAQRQASKDGDSRYILQGVLGFLNAQALLWDGIHRELMNAEKIGKLISPIKLN